MKRDCWWSEGQKSEREGGYRGFWARSDFGADQCLSVGVEALRAAIPGGWNPSAIAQMKAGGRARIDGFTPTCCPSTRTTPTGCSQDPGKSGKNGVKWSGNPTKCLGSIETLDVCIFAVEFWRGNPTKCLGSIETFGLFVMFLQRFPGGNPTKCLGSIETKVSRTQIAILSGSSWKSHQMLRKH